MATQNPTQPFRQIRFGSHRRASWKPWRRSRAAVWDRHRQRLDLDA